MLFFFPYFSFVCCKMVFHFCTWTCEWFQERLWYPQDHFPYKGFLTFSKGLCPCGYIWHSDSEVVTRSSPGPSSFFKKKYSKIVQGNFLQIFIKSKLESSQMVGMGNLFWVKILLILRENINLRDLRTNLTREIVRTSDSGSCPDLLTQMLSKRKHSNLGFNSLYVLWCSLLLRVDGISKLKRTYCFNLVNSLKSYTTNGRKTYMTIPIVSEYHEDRKSDLK